MKRDRRKAHQRSIAGGVRIRSAGNRLARTFKPLESFARGDTYVEAGAGAVILSRSPPGDEAIHEVPLVEAIAVDKVYFGGMLYGLAILMRGVFQEVGLIKVILGISCDRNC